MEVNATLCTEHDTVIVARDTRLRPQKYSHIAGSQVSQVSFPFNSNPLSMKGSGF